MNKESLVQQCEALIEALSTHINKPEDRLNDYSNFNIIYEQHGSLLRQIKYFLTVADQSKIYFNDCERFEARLSIRSSPARDNIRIMLLEGYKTIVASFKEAIVLYR